MSSRRQFSAHHSLYLIIFTCWILPLLAVVLWFSSQQEESTRLRTEEAVVTSVDYAMSELTRRLEDSLGDSRSASYDRTIEDVYHNYLATGSTVQLYGGTASYLSTQYGYNSLYDAALVLYWEEPDFPVLTTRNGLSERGEKTRTFIQAGQGTLLEVAQNLGTAALFYQVDDTLYLIRNLVDSHYEPYATLILPFQMDDLLEPCEGILWAESVAFSVDGIYLPVMGEPEPLSTLDLYYSGDTDRFSVGSTAQLEQYELRLEVAVFGDLLQGEREGFYHTLSIVVLLSGLLFILIVRYVYHNISKPMDTLLEGSGRLAQGELGYQITPLPTGIEFYQLTQRFNDLSLQLSQQFDRHTQEQQALADAKIKALQSQINPHFLNNTLEMINWQARMSGDETVCQMISSLSVMLNAAMARGGSATVTMKQEFSYIEAYLFITAHRFGSRLQVKMDIDAGVWTAIVPRLILQPVVENAIEHGIALRSSGEIFLHIYVEQDFLVVDVEHAGTISETDRTTIDRLLSWDGSEHSEQGSARIGIRNVQHRLKMLCGEDSGLTIVEYETGRVRSQIKLPLVFSSVGDSSEM